MPAALDEACKRQTAKAVYLDEVERPRRFRHLSAHGVIV